MATVTLHSFSELAEVLRLPPMDNARTEPEEGRTSTTVAPSLANVAMLPDLATLLATLQAASDTLRQSAQRDAALRAEALAALERYEAILGRQREAAGACETARRVQTEAQSLAEGAFSEDCRAAAQAVVAQAAQAAVAAATLAEARRREAEAFAADVDVPRLIEARERQRREAEQQTRAQERAHRRAGNIAKVRELLHGHRLDEAEAALAPLRQEAPDDEELTTLAAQLRQRQLQYRIDGATTALPTAYRDLRRQPEEAMRRLEGLDVAGLPDDLARRVFGAWAEACARLCREQGIDAPLRYAPDPGCGLVLMPDGKGGHTVLSALGFGARFPVGTKAPDQVVRRSRPLRTASRRED